MTSTYRTMRGGSRESNECSSSQEHKALTLERQGSSPQKKEKEDLKDESGRPSLSGVEKEQAIRRGIENGEWRVT